MRLDLMRNGAVRFVRGREPRAEQSETTRVGNVELSIVNQARDGVPPHFAVSFVISCSHQVEGIEVTNQVQLETVFPAENPQADYAEVEDNAARQLPALLRSLAACLEEDIEQAARERSPA